MLVAHYSDRVSGAEAWLVVDTFLHGVAGGGIRMDTQVDESLVRSLASTMTMKLSMIEPPLGGAKCGIKYDSRAPESREVLRRVIRAFGPFLRTCWVTGSDLGTDWSNIVQACKEEAGIPHPQFALMAAYSRNKNGDITRGIERLADGTSLVADRELDLTMSNVVTGWTVFAATEEAVTLRGETLRGQRVAIQGFGVVGGSAAHFLSQAGAVVVAVSDELGAILSRSTESLDVTHLLQLRERPSRKTINRERLSHTNGFEFSERDSVLYHPVDILIPAAGSNIPLIVDRVRARYIIEAANDPFTEPVEETLCRAGVTVVPDAIANAGNAGLYGLLVSGEVAIEKEAIFELLRARVKRMVREVSRSNGMSPRTALRQIARSTIEKNIRQGHSTHPNGMTDKDFKSLASEGIDVRFHSVSPYALAESR